MSAVPADHGNPIVYTIFRDTSAAKKFELAETWGEIVGRIKSPKVASEKSALPLISLGVYGNVRTDKNALRHKDNLRAITGIEGDYDGETVPMEDAAERRAGRHQGRVLHLAEPYPRQATLARPGAAVVRAATRGAAPHGGAHQWHPGRHPDRRIVHDLAIVLHRQGRGPGIRSHRGRRRLDRHP